MPKSLDRFVDAQAPVYSHALAELHAGAKRGHWMWFIFPQLAGLGRSSTAQFFAIDSLLEARQYFAHPLLGTRLEECTHAMLDWAGERSAGTILGPIDALKFVSSMTLFEAAGGNECFASALDKFNAGKRDVRTLEGL